MSNSNNFFSSRICGLRTIGYLILKESKFFAPAIGPPWIDTIKTQQIVIIWWVWLNWRNENPPNWHLILASEIPPVLIGGLMHQTFSLWSFWTLVNWPCCALLLRRLVGLVISVQLARYPTDRSTAGSYIKLGIPWIHHTLEISIIENQLNNHLSLFICLFTDARENLDVAGDDQLVTPPLSSTEAPIDLVYWWRNDFYI